MKNISDGKWVLLMYCIPCFYIAMWLDITYRISLPYVLLPYVAATAVLLILRIVLGKAGKHKIAFRGFILNMASVWLCIILFQQGNLDRWNAYFGPFFPLPLMAAVIVVEMFDRMMKQDK